MAVINSAYEMRFVSTFKTSTDETWEIQIYDRKWSFTGGAGMGTPPYAFNVTDGGCQIKYDCDGDEKFAPIIGAKLTLNFMVDLEYTSSGWTGAHGSFIDDLLGISGASYLPYEEGDLFVVVRKGPLASGSILFAGEYLMDLDTLPDTPGVYPIALTFTDGIGKLKEISFQSSNVDNTYDEYKYMGHMTFIYWIGQCLQHTKFYVNQQNPNAFWDNASDKVIFRTTVRWFNTKFYKAPSSTLGTSDPLRQTKGTMKWADKYNPSNQKRNILSAYEVLKQICRSWGMRVIYFNGNYHFTQIREFDEPSAAKLALFAANAQWTTAVDQYTARYYANGNGYGNMVSSIGNYTYFRYFNQFWNISAPSEKIQKLEGCTYKFLPVLNEVTTDLVHEGYQNIFPGFPVPNAYGTNFIELLGGPFLNSAQYKYQTTFVLTMTAGTHAILNSGYDVTQFAFRVIAFDDVVTPTLANALATLTFDPVANSYGWDDSPTYTGFDLGAVITLTSSGGPFPGNGATSTFNLLPDLKFPGYRDASTKYGIMVTSPVYVQNTAGNWINIQTGGTYGATAICTYTDPIDSSALTPPSWSTGLFNNFISTIQPVSTNSSTSNTIFVDTQTSDSHRLDWGKVYWGDGPEYWDDSALLVKTSSTTWEFSDWTSKDWARRDFLGSAVPADSGHNFNDLLNYQMKECQAVTIRRATWAGLNSMITHFETNGKPYFINPVGIMQDCDVDSNGTVMKTRYFFRRGTFDLMNNQWEGEWIEVKIGTPISNQQRMAGGTNLQGRGQGRQMIATGSYTGSRARISLLQSQVGVVKDVAITSLNIETPNGDLELGTNYNLLTGDKVYLSYRSGVILEVELTADLTAESTRIEFNSITPTKDSNGAVMIQVPILNVMEQSNRKTSGKIAGLDVTATTIDEATHVGREYLSIRCDGYALAMSTYYMFYGGDNNKSDRMNQENANAPSEITAQSALKSARFYAEHSYEFESGKIAISASTGATVKITLYKASIVESSSKMTMTEIGSATIIGAGNATPKTSTFVITSASLSSGECIIPHVYCTGDEGTVNFKGQIAYTLIRK
jgi:hypothetical protein